MRSFLLDQYLWLKSIHLIFVFAWMAGMMYLPRLFVYHHNAEAGGELEGALVQMEGRLDALHHQSINYLCVDFWLAHDFCQ